MDPALIAHCRAGFEPEAAADLDAIAAATGTTLALDAPAGRGYVVGRPAHFAPARMAKALAAAAPVFVRSLFVGDGPHALFDPATARGRPDRVVPLVALIESFRNRLPLPTASPPPAFSELRLETADTNEGKALSGLARALAAPLAAALAERGALVAADAADAARLHVLFADGAHVHVGISLPPWSSASPMGIPRLRMPREAPSRSTLKLAEAFVAFLGAREPELLRAGMKAVDLGAAPGGWSWQLAHRGLFVTAVDNGRLRGEVARDSLVTHLAVDGLTYRPRRPVDWMVCDIAAPPARIAALVGRWIAEGDARRTIFNLKLPMKKRHAEVQRCEAIIRDALARAGVRGTLALRQLYHDREEVTGFVAAAEPVPRRVRRP